MPFNETDYQKAPWTAGIMTLTHDECLFVIDTCKIIESEFQPESPYYDPISDFYIISTYNRENPKKSINGDTYNVLSQYGENVNGIDENGVIGMEPTTEEIPAE